MGTCEAKKADPAACFELVAHPSQREIPFSQTTVIFHTSQGSFSGLLSSSKPILGILGPYSKSSWAWYQWLRVKSSSKQTYYHLVIVR